MLRKKAVEDFQTFTLNRCLTAVDLTLLGIGVVIGAGIFILTGIAAATHSTKTFNQSVCGRHFRFARFSDYAHDNTAAQFGHFILRLFNDKFTLGDLAEIYHLVCIGINFVWIKFFS